MVHPAEAAAAAACLACQGLSGAGARQDRRRNRGRCRCPAKTRGAAGAEGDPGPARGRRVQRRCPQKGAAADAETGPEAASHLEVAIAVASGQADTGLGVRAAATALDLGFVPVAWEDFDIVLSGDTLPAAEPLIAALRTAAVQSSIGALGGYDLSRAGSVEMLA